MISRFGLLLCRAFSKVMPDPFVLAVLLTLVTFALALLWTDASPGQVLTWWSGDTGVWSAGILRFAMQMCLILVTGHALASSPPMSWAMDRLAGGPGRRGDRRDVLALRVGDTVDFWRVEEASPWTLVLRAEMRIPGEARLVLECLPDGGATNLVMSALFVPHGALGPPYT